MTDTKPPLVFISYSHDSRQHRLWVADLSARLRMNGVEVILDQLDLSPGEDVALFMEHGLAIADRVLAVCTDQYVRKADAGMGGVGYERMIVTAELLRNLGTRKFIPVIRQASSAQMMPRFMGTRFFIDLRDDAEEPFQTLLRELHQQPAIKKPPLGRNPFSVLPSGNEAPTETTSIPSIAELRRAGTDPLVVYDTALSLARAGDLLGWRQLLKSVRPAVIADLVQWKQDYQVRREANESILASQFFGEAVTLAAPLLLMATAGIESGRDRFTDQRGLLGDLLALPDWWGEARSIPTSLGFYYQLFHGALCMDTGQLRLAAGLFQMAVHIGEGESRPVWQTRRLIGYPPWFPSATAAWNYAIDRAEKWPWVAKVFETPLAYRVAVTAYYMTLNLYELAELLGAGRHSSLDTTDLLVLDVPLCFATEPEEVAQRAMRLLAGQSDQLAQAISVHGVSFKDIGANWGPWIGQNKKWLRQLLSNPILGDLNYQRLPEILGIQTA